MSASQSNQIGEWATELRLFIAETRKQDLPPDRRKFAPIRDWQCRISGGALLKFLRFISASRGKNTSNLALSQALESDKRLIFLTDLPGSAAGHEILKMFRPSAIWMLRNEWEAWQADPERADSNLRFHFEYWNFWSDDIQRSWEFDYSPSAKYWVHHEGYSFKPEGGVTVCHLWEWCEDKMQLRKATIEKKPLQRM